MSSTRALFVLPSLRGGGAERVVSLLLRHLKDGVGTPQCAATARRPAATNPMELHLALVEKTGPHLADLPPDVTVHDLQATRVSRAIPSLIRLVRRLQPDVVFSTISHLNLAVAMSRWTWPARTRLILRETATCRQVLSSTRWPTARQALYRRFYRSADAIVCQTPFMRCDLKRSFQVPSSKLRIIPNPVDFAAIERSQGPAPSPFTGPGPHLVSLGRLRPVKGTARVLSAFPSLLARQPTAQLWLLGDGPCELPLRRQATDLRIADRVHFVGYQANPYRWLARADLMVLGSHNESSPSSVLESVACGCPLVSARHPGGTYEILSHLGLAHRFVSQLERWEAPWFDRLPSEALERARARYAVERVAAEYRELFAAVIRYDQPRSDAAATRVPAPCANHQ